METKLLERLAAHRFSRLENVEHYLSKDTVECLICGERFKFLGKHLSSAHSITSKQYRVALNIPRKLVLMGAHSARWFSKVHRTEKNISRMRDPETRSLAIKLAKETNRTNRTEVPLSQVGENLKSLNNVRRQLRNYNVMAEALDALHEDNNAT